MARQPGPDKVSFGEYLVERRATAKSEFRAGEIFSMAGGTPVHARLSVRFSSLLEQMKGSRCEVYNSDLRIYVAAVDEGMYPDVSMLCGEPEFFDRPQDVLMNPTLVVEVLSSSTREYDQSLKASFHRTIHDCGRFSW